MNKRRSNNQRKNSWQFPMGQVLHRPKSPRKWLPSPFGQQFLISWCHGQGHQAQHWNLPVLSQKRENGKKSIKNILIWVGCQGWSQEHRSQLKATQLTGESLEELSHQWRNKRQGQATEHRESVILRKMSTQPFHARAFLWRVSVLGPSNPASAVMYNIEAASWPLRFWWEWDSSGIISKSA